MKGDIILNSNKNSLSIKKDKRGNVYITSILITVIILIIITGVSFTIMNNTINTVNQDIGNSKLNHITDESLNLLISTEGSPVNWEKLNINSSTVCGLKSSNNYSLVLSYEKIIRLSENYNILIKNNIFNNKINSQLIIKPLNYKIDDIKLGNNPISINNIYSRKRIILIDYYTNYKIKDLDSDNNYKCKNHNNQWICTYFNSNNDLNKYDYYLICENYSNSYYIVNEYNIKSSTSNKIHLNNYLDELNSDINFIHIKSSNDFKGFIICVPKNFNSDFLKYEYFTYQKAEIILNTWYD